jgi:hypothetical protein
MSLAMNSCEGFRVQDMSLAHIIIFCKVYVKRKRESEREDS